MTSTINNKIYINTHFTKTLINKKTCIKILSTVASPEGEDRGLWEEEKWSTSQSIKRDTNEDNVPSTET